MPTKLIPTKSNTINSIYFGTDFEFQIVYVPSEANSEIAMYPGVGWGQFWLGSGCGVHLVRLLWLWSLVVGY